MSEIRVFDEFEKIVDTDRAKSYHVLVAYYVSDYYTYSFAVHLFLPRKPFAHNAFKRAEELLDRYFKDWRNGEIKSKFMGIEELPIEVNDEYYTVVSFAPAMEYVAKYYSNVPKELIDKIVDYRFRHLTIDIDLDRVNLELTRATEYKPNELSEKARMKLIEVIKEVANKFININFYKTKRGYHIRILLPNKKDFDELIDMRDYYLDDSSRIKIDLAYHEKGLDYLTNMLFNEKYWYEGDRLVHQVEQPVKLEDIINELKPKPKERMNKTETNENNVVDIENDTLIKEIDKLTEEIMEALSAIRGVYDVVLIYKNVARVGKIMISSNTSLGELIEYCSDLSRLTVKAYSLSNKGILVNNRVFEPLKAVLIVPNMVYGYTQNLLVWLSLDVVYNRKHKSMFKLDKLHKKVHNMQVAEMINKLPLRDKTIILDLDKKESDITDESINDILDRLCKQYKIISPYTSYNKCPEQPQ